jgi:diaminohydroxyphosphoribosylaminopyrimidine deaminase/5-amino-6-(5-phosphoribosylamino)uracil reductase
MAMSLDGRTSTAPGDSPWITGDQSRALVHRWRAESDAIAVGIGTVLADDPLLTARGGDAVRQPLRVVFDRSARLPLDSQLLRTLDQASVLVVVSPEADPERTRALADAGAETLVADGRSSPSRIASALADLGRRGITSLFLEGGPTLAAAFQAADQLDEARVFVAPILLGGTDPRAGGADSRGPRTEAEPPPAGPPEAVTGPARRSALSTETTTIGEDTLIATRFKEW